MEDNVFSVGDWVIVKGLKDYEDRVGVVKGVYFDNLVGWYCSINGISYNKSKEKNGCFPISYLVHYYKD